MRRKIMYSSPYRRIAGGSSFLAERLVLPPGYGRAVGVEIGERLPVGSDVLFDIVSFATIGPLPRAIIAIRLDSGSNMQI